MQGRKPNQAGCRLENDIGLKGQLGTAYNCKVRHVQADKCAGNNLAILLSETVSQHIIKFRFVNAYKHALINKSFQSVFTFFHDIKVMIF